ncbi:adenosine receptor A1 [Planococcus citri]|uniref:adenosine receptor A1 n=1 Tax=Planococcus citri TaxID=170843 RepID=UPI0031F78106
MSTDYETAFSKLNVSYTVSEVLVSAVTIVGNSLVLVAFKRERKLRRRTNYYIISLAVADLLVGLIGIPCAILASVGLPRQFHACLFSVSLLIVLCTISIFSLVAVSVDRYWAILYPMSYSRNVTSKFALGIICLCWISGGLVGFLPLFGWNAGEGVPECSFTKVMDYNFLVFLYFATIVFPALLLAAFYAHIYNVILKQLRQMVSMNETAAFHTGFSAPPSTVRILADARKKEVKATQNLSIIVLFFILCWMPLYTINCIQAFCENCDVPELVLNLCIILSHLNSAGNPLLYAYRLSDFRTALRCLLFGFNSTDNLYARTEQGTNDFSMPKARQMISININPRKYLFPKNSLFKFDNKDSNAETRFNSRRDEYSLDSSNDRYLTLATNSTYEYSRRSADTDSNNYGYLNSEYIDSNLSLSGTRKKRIQTIMDNLDNSSYILMANFDNVRNSGMRKQIFEADRRVSQPLQRRHSWTT